MPIQTSDQPPTPPSDDNPSMILTVRSSRLLPQVSDAPCTRWHYNPATICHLSSRRTPAPLIYTTQFRWIYYRVNRSTASVVPPGRGPPRRRNAAAIFRETVRPRLLRIGVCGPSAERMVSLLRSIGPESRRFWRLWSRFWRLFQRYPAAAICSPSQGSEIRSGVQPAGSCDNADNPSRK